MTNIKEEQKQEETALRQLIIETDGNRISIAKNTLSGNLELKAILTELLTQLR